MNLIQIQERLKEVPLNAVIAYANGSNPEIPPYLALSEIQRRNAMQQKAQSAPDSSVKEQIERRAIEQGANQLMADQAQQQQAQQMMQQQAAQQPQPVPENIPQPEGMAAGGITSIPVGDMFNFDRGGIVSFADGDYVDNPFKDEEPKAEQKTRGIKKPAPKTAKAPPPKDYMAMAEEALNVKPTMPESPQSMLEKAKLANPELAKPIGEEYMGKLQALAQQDLANQQAFEQREERGNLRDIANALIAAGEATRGGGGIGSLLGGYGRAYNASREAADERRARQEALRREQDMNMAKLNFEVQNLRRAEARGDVKAMYDHQAEIAKIQNDINKNKVSAFTDLAKTQQTGQYYKDMAEIQRMQASQRSQPEFISLVEYFKKKNPSLTDQQAYDMAVKYSRAGITAGGAGDRADERIAAEVYKRYGPQINLANLEPDPIKRQQKLDELQTRINEEIAKITKSQGIGGLPPPAGTGTSGTWGKAETVSQ